MWYDQIPHGDSHWLIYTLNLVAVPEPGRWRCGTDLQMPTAAPTQRRVKGYGTNTLTGIGQQVQPRCGISNGQTCVVAVAAPPQRRVEACGRYATRGASQTSCCVRRRISAAFAGSCSGQCSGTPCQVQCKQSWIAFSFHLSLAVHRTGTFAVT